MNAPRERSPDPQAAYTRLAPSHFLDAHCRIVREWRAQDVVTFTQVVDLTSVDLARQRRRAAGVASPSYTSFVVDAVARALRDNPKMNRIVHRGLTGYRWIQLHQVDVGVGVEAVDGDVDIAYATIIRNADTAGIDEIARTLVEVAAAPLHTPQLQRLRRLPAALTAWLARLTGLHPAPWVKFRGGAASVTSPAKYGVETVIVKSSWPVQFAFGRVADRAMVIDGQCVPRRSFVLSLSWHRELTTGAVAARFFEDVVQRLQRHESRDDAVDVRQPDLP